MKESTSYTSLRDSWLIKEIEAMHMHKTSRGLEEQHRHQGKKTTQTLSGKSEKHRGTFYE